MIFLDPFLEIDMASEVDSNPFSDMTSLGTDIEDGMLLGLTEEDRTLSNLSTGFSSFANILEVDDGYELSNYDDEFSIGDDEISILPPSSNFSVSNGSPRESIMVDRVSTNSPITSTTPATLHSTQGARKKQSKSKIPSVRKSPSMSAISNIKGSPSNNSLASFGSSASSPMVVQNNKQKELLDSDDLELPLPASKTSSPSKANINVVKTGRWTPEEHKKFLEGIAHYGRNWEKVAQNVVTRTTVQIRSHAQKYFKKVQQKDGNAESDDFMDDVSDDF
jgi:SHAQKYF class myb-like DNA-binding protein